MLLGLRCTAACSWLREEDAECRLGVEGVKSFVDAGAAVLSPCEEDATTIVACRTSIFGGGARGARSSLEFVPLSLNDARRGFISYEYKHCQRRGWSFNWHTLTGTEGVVLSSGSCSLFPRPLSLPTKVRNGLKQLTSEVIGVTIGCVPGATDQRR